MLVTPALSCLRSNSRDGAEIGGMRSPPCDERGRLGGRSARLLLLHALNLNRIPRGPSAPHLVSSDRQFGATGATTVQAVCEFVAGNGPLKVACRTAAGSPNFPGHLRPLLLELHENIRREATRAHGSCPAACHICRGGRGAGGTVIP